MYLTSAGADGYLTILGDVNLVKEPGQPGAVTLVLSTAPIVRCYFVGAGPRGESRCWVQASFSAGPAIQLSERLTLFAEVSHFRTVLRPGPLWGDHFLQGFQAGLGLGLRFPE